MFNDYIGLDTEEVYILFYRRSRTRDRDGSYDRGHRDVDKHESDHRVRDHDRDRRRGSSRDRKRSRSRDRRDRDRRRSRSKDVRRRSRSRDKKRRSRSRGERRRSRSKDRRRGTRSPDRRRSRSPRRRSRSKDRRYYEKKSAIKENSSLKSFNNRRRSPSPPRPFRRGRTPPNGLGNRSPPEELTPEERDARTVFCMQLSQRIRARDLEEFFSSVGKVRDVRLITCNKTKRFKGIAYIEFKDPESVALVS